MQCCAATQPLVARTRRWTVTVVTRQSESSENVRVRGTERVREIAATGSTAYAAVLVQREERVSYIGRADE